MRISNDDPRARVCLFPRDRFATMIYAPIFEVFGPLCLGLARPEADDWVMPTLAACMCLVQQGWRSGRQVRGGKRLGVWERLRCELGVGGGKTWKGWIEDRQDEDGRCVEVGVCESVWCVRACVWKSKSSQELLGLT